MNQKEKQHKIISVFGESLRKSDALGGVTVVLNIVTPSLGVMGVESKASVHGPAEMTDVLLKLSILGMIAEYAGGGGRICKKEKACELCARLWTEWEEATSESDTGTVH